MTSKSEVRRMSIQRPEIIPDLIQKLEMRIDELEAQLAAMLLDPEIKTRWQAAEAQRRHETTDRPLSK